MNALETRGVARERVLLFAQLTVENNYQQHRVRIRDLSSQGVQAEGDVEAQPGEQVEVDFGSAGKVPGVIAWRDGSVFGLTFEQEIEPDLVRRANLQKDEGSYQPPWYVRGLGRTNECRGLARKV